MPDASLRGVQQVMVGFCVAATFSGSLLAQEPAPNAPLGVVSLTRIRTALTAHPSPLRLTPPEPTFRVIVWETQHFFELSDRLDLPSEHAPPGGLYAFEQRQQLGNPWVGQPVFKIDVLPPLDQVHRAVTAAERARVERVARDGARHALVEMCLARVCQTADR